MSGRLDCWGGPLDGRRATLRSTGTRAYIDDAGKVHPEPAPGRAAYEVAGVRWEFIGHLWRRCSCGAWVQDGCCQLCGAGVDS